MAKPLIMSAFLGMYPFMLYANVLSSIIVLLLSFVFRNYIISNEI